MLNATCLFQDPFYLIVMHYGFSLFSVPVYGIAFWVLLFKCPERFKSYRNLIVLHIISGIMMEFHVGVIWKLNILYPWTVLCSNGLAAEYAAQCFQMFIAFLAFNGLTSLFLFFYRMEVTSKHAQPSLLHRIVNFMKFTLYFSFLILAVMTILVYPVLKYQMEYKRKVEQKIGKLPEYLFCDSCYFLDFDSKLFILWFFVAYFCIWLAVSTGLCAAIVTYQSLKISHRRLSPAISAIQKNFFTSLIISIIMHLSLLFIPLTAYFIIVIFFTPSSPDLDLLMPFLDLESHLFPSFPNNEIIFKVYLFTEKLSTDCIFASFYISIIGIFLTIFHLTVLTQKNLMTNSVVSIMIGVATCDILSMIISIATKDMILNFYGSDCTPPNSLLVFQIFWVLMTIRDDVIRCSTWLTVLMALIRYLVSKYYSKSRFQTLSSFNFGFQSSVKSFLVSSLFSVGFYLCVTFVEVGTWKPARTCTNIPLDTVKPLYDQSVSDLFSVDDGAALRIFQFINGVLSKIIPCILLPVLTTLLAVELRRTEKNRSSSSVLYKNNTEKTTILVITMTFLIFVASLPTGIATVFQVVYTDLGFLFIFIYVDTICNSLLLFNASINCFICMAMSSQYRKTAKKIFRISEKVDSNGASLRRMTN